MRGKRAPVQRHAAILLLTLSLAISALAKPGLSPQSANIQIGNFGQINETYYRGAQPSSGDYPSLATLGVKTVIDLTRDGDANEKDMVERAGMKFYRIPMTTGDRPAESAVTEFLKLVNDPANQPVFVHCQGGRHRTGVMTAVYRMTQDGWTADRAYQEMKQYNFEGFPGHPTLKRFVYDYFTQLDHLRVAAKVGDAQTPAPIVPAQLSGRNTN